MWVIQTSEPAKKTTGAAPGQHPDFSQQVITWNDKPALLQPARPVLPC